MDQQDHDFREAFKPLSIPSSFDKAENLEDQVVFTLATLGEATAAQVYEKLKDDAPDVDANEVSSILDGYFEKGLLKGQPSDAGTIYDLSKITEPNKGFVNPDLLAPGLD